MLPQHTTLGAQGNTSSELVIATQGHPAGVAHDLAELNGSGTNTTGAGMNQHLFTRFGRTQFKNIQPGGTEDFRNRGGICPAQLGRDRQQMPRIDHDFFSHTATRQQGTDPVTHFPAGLTSGLDDFTRTLQAQDLAGTRRGRVHTGFLQQIGSIQAGRLDCHSYLPVCQLYCGLFTPLQGAALGLHSSHSASIVKYQLINRGTQAPVLRLN